MLWGGMSNDDLAYWRSRGINFNPGVPSAEDETPDPPRFGRPRPTGRPELVRISPWPMPVVLDEAQHHGERLVYESLLWDSPKQAGFSAYSLPLPLSGNRRLEADFAVMTAHGIALIEVKGGIVRVDSRPGPGVRWAQETRTGRPTGAHVSPAQLYRVSEVFSVMAQTMAGVEFGGRIAQMLVLPHTSQSNVDPQLLARLRAPNRDFARIVFAEDLATHGIWNLVNDELTMPGRSRPLDGEEVRRLIVWIKGELDVQPGPDAPMEIPISAIDIGRFSNVPPPGGWPERPVENLPRASPANFAGRPARPNPPASASRRKPSWLWRGGIGLAGLIALALWAGRPTPQAPAAAPSLVPSPAAATSAAPPARPAPTSDPFQAALSRAATEPEKRIPAGGTDWVRALGPVTGRPGCQLAEMSYSSQVYNVIACRDGERGPWRY